MTVNAYAFVAELNRERNAYREALGEIARQDWVENVLDPQWAARIAEDALKEFAPTDVPSHVPNAPRKTESPR